MRTLLYILPLMLLWTEVRGQAPFPTLPPLPVVAPSTPMNLRPQMISLAADRLLATNKAALLAVAPPAPPMIVFPLNYQPDDMANYGTNCVIDIFGTNIANAPLPWPLVKTVPSTATNVCVPNNGDKLYCYAVARSLFTGLTSAVKISQ
jgi:hypothetical protein